MSYSHLKVDCRDVSDNTTYCVEIQTRQEHSDDSLIVFDGTEKALKHARNTNDLTPQKKSREILRQICQREVTLPAR